MRTVLMMVVGALALTAVATGCGKSCDASNCSGCCDASGACQAGSLDTACGKGGALCVACLGAQHCQSVLAICAFPGGNGSGNGSGTASGNGASASGGSTGGVTTSTNGATTTTGGSTGFSTSSASGTTGTATTGATSSTTGTSTTGTSGATTGGGFGAGTLNGPRGFAVGNALLASTPQDGGGPNLSSFDLVMVDRPLSCGDLRDGGLTRSGVTNVFGVVLSGSTPYGPGTYAPAEVVFETVVNGTATYADLSPGSGSITFNTLDVSGGSGSFSTVLPDAGPLSGTFDAPFCVQ